MASIARRDDGRWRARYRDSSGREHARHFTRRADAQRWLDEVVTAVNTGAWVDPARARVTVAEWAQEWLGGQSHLKPSSWERYVGILREHVLPEWGEHRIADVGHAEIQRWVTGLTLDSSPSTVHKIHRTLSLVLKHAVKDGRLVRNPADGVNLPRIVATEHVYLTHDQVDELAERCGPHRLTVLFLASTGVRFARSRRGGSAGSTYCTAGPPSPSRSRCPQGTRLRQAGKQHPRSASTARWIRIRPRSRLVPRPPLPRGWWSQRRGEDQLATLGPHSVRATSLRPRRAGARQAALDRPPPGAAAT